MWSSSLKSSHCHHHHHRGNSEFYEKLEQLPPSFSACRRPSRSAEAGALGQQQGALTLISKDLSWTKGPASVWEPSFRLPGPFPRSQESKKDPETVTVNQFSVRGDVCVLFSHIHPGMGWPWISGPETELVDNLFSTSITFLWGPMLLRRLSILGDRVLFHKNTSPSPKSFVVAPSLP